MNRTKDKRFAYLALALTIFVASPIDDIIFTSVFGTVLFGLGTTEFYIFLIPTTILSVLLWRRHSLKHPWRKKPNTKRAQHSTSTPPTSN